MPPTVQIRASIIEQILQHARSEPRLECCGLLAGHNGLITRIFPAKNALASATQYEIAPRELFELFRQIRSEGLKHLGQYHSHPSSENTPSPRDIEYAGYPDAIYIIVSPFSRFTPSVRAFSIREGEVRELEIAVTE